MRSVSVAASSLERPDLRMAPSDGLGLAVIRCHRHKIAEAAAVLSQACSLVAPLICNTTVFDGRFRLSWTEPGAWLLAGDPLAVGKILVSLGEEPAGPVLVAEDVSAGRVALALSGARAPALIGTGCPLDLHPDHFPPGRCAAGLFNDIPIWLDKLSAEPCFRLVCERPLAHGLWRQLTDAARLLT